LKQKITAIGEILFDIYPDSKNLGGAPLNFLYHIFKLTGQGNIVSKVGKDVLGGKAKNYLTKQEMPINFIQEDRKHPTGVTTVTLGEDKIPSFNIDTERAYDFIENTEILQKLISEETDCLYFGSLAQRNEVSRTTIHSYFGKNIKYFCDINIRQNFYSPEVILKSLTTADVLKLNIDELELLNYLTIGKDFNIKDSAVSLMKKFNIELIAVTKGAGGSSLFFGDEVDDHKISSSEIVDTLGAGDAFAAIICLGYINKWKLSKMNRLANNFANEICKIRSALPGTDDVYKMLKEKMNDDK
jgi:fructokinase